MRQSRGGTGAWAHVTKALVRTRAATRVERNTAEGAPASERTHAYHSKMHPLVLLGPKCNHDVGVMSKFPVLTPEQTKAVLRGAAKAVAVHGDDSMASNGSAMSVSEPAGLEQIGSTTGLDMMDDSQAAAVHDDSTMASNITTMRIQPCLYVNPQVLTRLQAPRV